MTRTMTIAIVLSILLAVGAPLVNAFTMAKQFKDYPSVRIDIEPYDPRDLLYGQYLRFRPAWNWKKDASVDAKERVCSGKNCCLCVGEGDVNPSVSVALCPPKGEVLDSCRYILRGQSWRNDHFENGMNRYYVDETIAKPLEDMFMKDKKKFSLDMHITPSGKSMPGELYIEDVPYKDFLSQQKTTTP